MPSNPADDDLLLTLLRNLKNATETLGPTHSSVESTRAIIKDHLRDMSSRGVTTNLAQQLQSNKPSTGKPASQPSSPAVSVTFENLPFRPKPAEMTSTSSSSSPSSAKVREGGS